MKALLIVDPQNDFISGSLPVPGAATAMDALADYVRCHGEEYACIITTADRHPATHCSFIPNGGKWPVHCVADSEGAAIWPALTQAIADSGVQVLAVTKGTDAVTEEYSIFANSQSAEKIRELLELLGIDEIDVCGLAGDVCVAATLRDAVRLFPHINFHLLPQFSPVIG